MDSSGSINATEPEDYVYGGTADWRTDLYQHSCFMVPTHKESIELINSYGRKFTPELKSPSVEMPYEGTFTQEDYAQKMIDEYIELGVPPKLVWPQSFNSDDVIYWVANTDFGDQAVALDDKYEATEDEVRAWHSMLKDNGAKIVAPPMWMLVEYDESSEYGMVPSAYVNSAKEHGLDIITWTLERTDSPLSLSNFILSAAHLIPPLCQSFPLKLLSLFTTCRWKLISATEKINSNFQSNYFDFALQFILLLSSHSIWQHDEVQENLLWVCQEEAGIAEDQSCWEL